MTFTKDSIFVQNAIAMFTMGYYTKIEDVPNLYNLREVVKECLEG